MQEFGYELLDSGFVLCTMYNNGITTEEMTFLAEEE
jgi:hypothetical protein